MNQHVHIHTPQTSHSLRSVLELMLHCEQPASLTFVQIKLKDGEEGERNLTSKHFHQSVSCVFIMGLVLCLLQ